MHVTKRVAMLAAAASLAVVGAAVVQPTAVAAPTRGPVGSGWWRLSIGVLGRDGVNLAPRQQGVEDRNESFTRTG